ncbi:CsbD family protein [Citreimonas sp.]|uniref:CsbD family protein n=1 Tax=Citreimonas sp. TaxID=3036715 RepID=UPI0035C8725A
MSEDQDKGTIKDVKGSAKETVGKATGDREVEQSGQADQAEGKLQKGMGKIKDAFRGKK